MTRRTSRQPGQRQLRVAETLRHALADIFERGILNDPDLVGVPITVTEVDISPDLKTARVYVMPLGGGGGDVAVVVEALKRCAKFLRGRVTAAVSLKFSPALQFEVDHSFEHAGHIEGLLRSPRVARDLDPEGDPEL